MSYIEDIQNKRNVVRNNIAKGFGCEFQKAYSELFGGVIEKAVYADTPQNRKLGRVGQEYHRGKGKKDNEVSESKKTREVKSTSNNSNNLTSLNSKDIEECMNKMKAKYNDSDNNDYSIEKKFKDIEKNGNPGAFFIGETKIRANNKNMKFSLHVGKTHEGKMYIEIDKKLFYPKDVSEMKQIAIKKIQEKIDKKTKQIGKTLNADKFLDYFMKQNGHSSISKKGKEELNAAKSTAEKAIKNFSDNYKKQTGKEFDWRKNLSKIGDMDFEDSWTKIKGFKQLDAAIDDLQGLIEEYGS